jgi:chemotaxis protein MotB
MNGYNPQLNPVALDTLPIIPLADLRAARGKSRAAFLGKPVLKPERTGADINPNPALGHREISTSPPPREEGGYYAARKSPLARFCKQDSPPSFYMSLSDLMCLLLVFFVLIFSLSEKGEERPVPQAYEPAQAHASVPIPDPFPKPAPLSQGLRRGIIGLTSLGQSDQGLNALVMAEPERGGLNARERELQSLLGQIRAEASQIAGLEVAVRGQSVLLRLPEVLLFETAQASLAPELQPTLQRLGQIIRSFPQTRVDITGHTDDVPINTALYASNWELSGARAAAVARALLQGGLDATRVSIKGMADQVPLLPNTSANNRMRNRRVEIELSGN